MVKEEVLGIVDKCFEHFKLTYRKEAVKYASQLIDSLNCENKIEAIFDSTAEKKFNIKKVKLGDKLIIDSYLKRAHNSITEQGREGYLKEEMKWENVCLKEKKEVIITGIRLLSNGYCEYENNEIKNIYCPTERFKVFIVVEKLFRKPFYINIPT